MNIFTTEELNTAEHILKRAENLNVFFLLINRNEVGIKSFSEVIPESFEKLVNDNKKTLLKLLLIKDEAGSDWEDIRNDPEMFSALCDHVRKKRMYMRKGLVPEDFDTATICEGCGPVWVNLGISNGGHVWACPWCWIRCLGLTVPKANMPTE